VNNSLMVFKLAFNLQYGGWYADVDYLFIHDIANLTNVLQGISSHKGKFWWLTNSIFNFGTRNNPLVLKYLEEVGKNFTGDVRTEIGPLFLTKIFRMHCNISDGFNLAQFSQGKLLLAH
jgi:hypothetical protein